MVSGDLIWSYHGQQSISSARRLFGEGRVGIEIYANVPVGGGFRM